MFCLFLVLICVTRPCNVLWHVTARYKLSFYYYYYYYYLLLSAVRAATQCCGVAAAGRPPLPTDNLLPHGAQQQTRHTPLLWSNDGTDRRADSAFSAL